MKKGIVVGLLGFFGAIGTALAGSAPAAAPAPNLFGSLSMFVLLGVVFYLFVFRPQSKRAKEHQSLVSQLAKGDEVITSGGLLGKVNGIMESHLVVTIAEGVDVVIQRQAVVQALPKGTLKTLSK